MEGLKIPVDEYTSPAPLTVERSASVPRVRDIMRKNGVRHVPVVDGKHAVGIISDRDLRMLDHLEGADAVTAGDVMTKNPFTVESGTSLEEVVFAMSKQKVGSAVVCDHGDVVGIFTSTDALNALVEILRGELPQ